ncbi:MAG: winged helix-turn-helix domain-containing protein [Streptosporangiaceae bacterium]
MWRTTRASLGRWCAAWTGQELLEHVWDAHWYGPTKVLDVHVAALRRKLGVDGLIETVYGRGFRLGPAE